MRVPARFVLVSLVAMAPVAAQPQASASAPAAPDAPAHRVEVKEDLQYAEGFAREPRRNRLDLYLPADSQKPPLVMFVHGGSWTGGKKEHVGGLCTALAQRGVAAAAINTQQHPFAEPAAMVADCGHALAFLHAHAAEHGYDGDRLFVMGHSSGAHLVSWLVLDDERLAAAGVPRAAVRGCIGLSGVYDVRPRHVIVDHVFGTDAKVRADASPFLHAGAGDPPCLLVSGERDIPGLVLSARMLERSLHEHGVAASTLELPGRTHVDYFFSLGSAVDPVLPRVLEFVREPGTKLTASAAPASDLLVETASTTLGGSAVEVVRPCEGTATCTLVWVACGSDEGKDARRVANVLASRGIAVAVVGCAEAAAVTPATAPALSRVCADLLGAGARLRLPARWFLGGAGNGGFLAASAAPGAPVPAPSGRLLFGTPVGARSIAAALPGVAAPDLVETLAAGDHPPALLFVQGEEDAKGRREDGLLLSTRLVQRGVLVHPVELPRTSTAASLAQFGSAGDVLLPLALAFLLPK
ncbi:MAG TPA: alpha/beta hydrolase [Planctomycetota bacterium]